MIERTRISKATMGIRDICDVDIRGEVKSLNGLEIVASGIAGATRLGDQVLIDGRLRGEIVSITEDSVRVLPFGSWDGTASGQEVQVLQKSSSISPCASWIGRVIDAFGRPLDGKPLEAGTEDYPYRAAPPDAFRRRTVGDKLETRMKAIDIFVPLNRGQRLGIFAGSGVGKSTLMAMLARQADADVIVMGLVGERGREVQTFIGKELGEEGMARSVLVVATSDQPPLTRRQAAWTATAVAEYFRDQGLHVLLMIDSVTRFAMAQREIGLASGEPPTSRGYTPTVFAELPRLLERSGPGSDIGPAGKPQGDITAVYTVLVDGDDMNEPIADTVRGILDGHVVLDRAIAEAGRYPAINIAKSISRMLPHCHLKAENAIMLHAKRALKKAAEVQELAQIGVYRPGTDPETDAALDFAAEAEKFLSQAPHEVAGSQESFAALYGLLHQSGIHIPKSELEL